MDTLKTPAEVEAVLVTIKGRMPNTYSSISETAKRIGSVAYKLVREGVRGVPNRFYAIEGGHVVGTPFAGEIQDDVAKLIVTFGAAHVVIWDTQVMRGGDGAN